MNQHPTAVAANQLGTGELRFDVIAGPTTAAVVLPKAMAYATVAGLPVEVGLYTAFVPMIVYSLLGRRRCSASAPLPRWPSWSARNLAWRCRVVWAGHLRALIVQYKPRVLALDLSRVHDIEFSALQMLMEGEQRMTEHGVVVWLVGLNPGVLEVVRNAGLEARLGRERMLFKTRAAITRYQATQATAGGMPNSASPS